MFYNGQTIICTKCDVSGHHSDSTQCSLYKESTSVEDNTEITKVKYDFVCQPAVIRFCSEFQEK